MDEIITLFLIYGTEIIVDCLILLAIAITIILLLICCKLDLGSNR